MKFAASYDAEFEINGVRDVGIRTLTYYAESISDAIIKGCQWFDRMKAKDGMVLRTLEAQATPRNEGERDGT